MLNKQIPILKSYTISVNGFKLSKGYPNLYVVWNPKYDVTRLDIYIYTTKWLTWEARKSGNPKSNWRLQAVFSQKKTFTISMYISLMCTFVDSFYYFLLNVYIFHLWLFYIIFMNSWNILLPKVIEKVPDSLIFVSCNMYYLHVMINFNVVYKKCFYLYV